MFNLFKKKEDNAFKLDEYALPSMSENQTPPSSTPPQDPMSPPDMGLPPSTPPQDHAMEFPSPPASPSMDASLAPQAFESAALSTPAPTEPVNDVSSDITQAKLETLEAKMALAEARLASIDQKLEVIYQMLAAEVSEETRQKLHVSSMVESAKRRG